MSFFALGRLKNHKVPHLHPNSTMFMPLNRLQLKICAFSVRFNLKIFLQQIGVQDAINILTVCLGMS